MSKPRLWMCPPYPRNRAGHAPVLSPRPAPATFPAHGKCALGTIQLPQPQQEGSSPQPGRGRRRSSSTQYVHTLECPS